MKERIKFDPPKETVKKPFCEWEPANKTDICSAMFEIPNLATYYHDSDVFPKALSFSKNDEDTKDTIRAYEKLLYSTISTKKALRQEDFAFRVVELPKTYDKKLKILIFYTESRISLRDFGEILKGSIDNSNEIIKNLGSKKLIPNLPE